MTSTHPGAPLQVGRATIGKRTLPADAPIDDFVSQLRRALHTIECRELGPQDAEQRFGPFADSVEGHQVLLIDADQLLARHPDDVELQDLVRAVRERGPRVDVALISPTR